MNILVRMAREFTMKRKVDSLKTTTGAPKGQS